MATSAADRARDLVVDQLISDNQNLTAHQRYADVTQPKNASIKGQSPRGAQEFRYVP
jgi:hypothetical protein